MIETYTKVDPTFIVEVKNGTIRDVNREAISGCNNYNPIGKFLDDVIYIQENTGDAISPVYFNERWYTLHKETLIWRGSPHIKIQLQSRKSIPDIETLSSLRKMIGFLLHRIRSPLTGMQGYVELVGTQCTYTNSIKYIGKINKGIDNLFVMLEDLESLQEISLKKVKLNNYSADPIPIIGEILDKYPSDIQQNIIFSPPGDSVLLGCSPGDLKRMLSALIQNAIEHAPVSEENTITIELPSANAVKVTHHGKPIPKSIAKQIFFPFVTRKATKLGLGLTMAMLYARRYKGSIFLTNNNSERGVSFTFCLPPSPPSVPTSFL